MPSLRAAIAGAILTLSVVGSPATSVAMATPTPPMCGPFGDPPATVTGSPKPNCPGGKLLGPSNDNQGTPRYACLYEPPQASPSKPLPLVVFLHGANDLAGSLASDTTLLQYLNSANVSDDPASPGFIIVAVQARKLAPPNLIPSPYNNTIQWEAGTGYRQFSPEGDVTVGATVYPESADAVAIDMFIAQEAATGKVNSNRIYVMGWSSGAIMTFLYGLNRPNIAAIAPYAGFNPFFYGTAGGAEDPCRQIPVDQAPSNLQEVQIFNTNLPIYEVVNDCDYLLACVSSEILGNHLMGLGMSVQEVIINSKQVQVSQCNYECNDVLSSDASSGTSGAGIKNHTRWPSLWTAQMLDFFRTHPLGSAPTPTATFAPTPGATSTPTTPAPTASAAPTPTATPTATVARGTPTPRRTATPTPRSTPTATPGRG